MNLQKDVSQSLHNKLRCSNYIKTYKQNVTEDFWEHYLQIQINWKVGSLTDM